MAILHGAWYYRDSAGAGWPGVSILWLGEMKSLICKFNLSVAAHTAVWAGLSLRYTGMLLGHWARITTSQAEIKENDRNTLAKTYTVRTARRQRCGTPDNQSLWRRTRRWWCWVVQRGRPGSVAPVTTVNRPPPAHWISVYNSDSFNHTCTDDLSLQFNQFPIH